MLCQLLVVAVELGDRAYMMGGKEGCVVHHRAVPPLCLLGAYLFVRRRLNSLESWDTRGILVVVLVDPTSPYIRIPTHPCSTHSYLPCKPQPHLSFFLHCPRPPRYSFLCSRNIGTLGAMFSWTWVHHFKHLKEEVVFLTLTTFPYSRSIVRMSGALKMSS